MDFDGPCKHPHGHNSRVEILLRGDTLDRCDILYEFSALKQHVRNWINETLDHKMLLRKDDPLVAPLQKLGEPVHLFDTNPTAEAIARLIYEQCERSGLPIEEVRVWETDSSWASYLKEKKNG